MIHDDYIKNEGNSKCNNNNIYLEKKIKKS